MDLTTNQAAAELGVSAQRVRQYIAQGRIRARKLGRDYLVDSESVAAVPPAAARQPRPGVGARDQEAPPRSRRRRLSQPDIPIRPRRPPSEAAVVVSGDAGRTMVP